MECQGKMRGNVIWCENVCKEFSGATGTIRVIDNVSLTVRENEFVVLFGPGQCGKTTMMNILSGLDGATSGSVYERGTLVQGPGVNRGVVYQTIALFPWMTVMGNVMFGPLVRGVPRKKARERAQYYIDLVGLTGFEKQYPSRLSGGMRQRVGIARAYCNDPAVLFMDEPFGHLDAQTRYLMQEEIMRIWTSEKRTVLFVTNNIEEALYLADRIILMNNCPTSIKKEYVIDLPHPRSYTDQAFLRLREEITNSMDKVI